MEITIKRKDFHLLIDILKTSKNQNDIKILSKHLEESEGFRTALIEYLKTSSEYQDLNKLIQKLVNANTENLNKLFSICEIIEKLIFDFDSRYKKNIFLQSILLSCIMLIFYEDKKQTLREKLVQIFLKIKILSKDEISIIETIQFFYLLGFYYFKNTEEYESALDCFKKSGLADDDPILIEVANLIQLKNETKSNEYNHNPLKNNNNKYVHDSNDSNNNEINDNDIRELSSVVKSEINKENNCVNQELSFIEANTDMEVDYPEDFVSLDITPLISVNKKKGLVKERATLNFKVL